MDQMKEGLKNYLAETSLHGFKYLQLNNRKPLKIFWVRKFEKLFVANNFQSIQLSRLWLSYFAFLTHL